MTPSEPSQRGERVSWLPETSILAPPSSATKRVKRASCQLAAAASWHDARFTHYIAAEGGANIDVSGNQLTLSPHALASLGLVYAPHQGFFGSATVSYVGGRYLDLANTARAGAYPTLDGAIGYRFGRYSVAVNAYNLTDERAPVTQSEFGDQSYYLLPPRRVFVDLTARF